MKVKHYVIKKSTLKRISMFAATILLTIIGSTVGEKYNKPLTTVNYTQQFTQQRLVINNDVRRASSMKHISLDGAKKMTVGATAYTGDTITSTGVRPIEGTTIAVDPKVIKYGTRVYIPAFNRIFIASDTGSAIRGNRIDIFMNDYDRCMEWGYRTIEIYILKD